MPVFPNRDAEVPQGTIYDIQGCRKQCVFQNIIKK